MLNELNILLIRSLSMVVHAACLRTVETCEDRSADKHCAQVRLKFNTMRRRERKGERKDEGMKKERKEGISNK